MRIRRIASGLAILLHPDAVETSLWGRLGDDDDQRCRQDLLTRYVPLPSRIARYEFRRRPAYGLERSDFDQLAYGGLREAIDRFDQRRSSRFGAFAKHRIRSSITDGIARSSEGGAQYRHRRKIELKSLRSIGETKAPGLDSIA